jgi:7-keto-8-aminopelargonate synthetase-like enzyme
MINDNKVFKASAVVGYAQNLKEVEKHHPYTITGACSYAVHPSVDREKIINQMKMEMLEKLKPLIDLFVVEPVMIGKTNLKGVLTVYLTEEQIRRLKESQEHKEKE